MAQVVPLGQPQHDRLDKPAMQRPSTGTGTAAVHGGASTSAPGASPATVTAIVRARSRTA